MSVGLLASGLNIPVLSQRRSVEAVCPTSLAARLIVKNSSFFDIVYLRLYSVVAQWDTPSAYPIKEIQPCIRLGHLSSVAICAKLKPMHDIEDSKEYDASDVEQIQKRKTKQGRKAKADLAVLTSLMSSDDGRDWLRRKLIEAGVFTSIYDENPIRMAFREGERNFGLRLWAELQRTPKELLLKFLTEDTE